MGWIVVMFRSVALLLLLLINLDAFAGSLVIASGNVTSAVVIGDKIVYSDVEDGSALNVIAYDSERLRRQRLAQFAYTPFGCDHALVPAHGGAYILTREATKAIYWTDGAAINIVPNSLSVDGCIPESMVGVDGSVWIGQYSGLFDALPSRIYHVASPTGPVTPTHLPEGHLFRSFRHISERFVVFEASRGEGMSGVRLCALSRMTESIRCLTYVDFVAELPTGLIVRHYIVGGGNLYRWDVESDSIALLSDSGAAYASDSATLGEVSLLRMDTYNSNVGFGLWSTGGTSQSTSMIHSLCPTDCDSYFSLGKLSEDQAVVVVSRSSDVRSLWRTNGTFSGTFPLSALPGSAAAMDPSNIVGQVVRVSDGAIYAINQMSTIGVVRWVRWDLNDDGIISAQRVVVERTTRRDGDGIQCSEGLYPIGSLQNAGKAVFVHFVHCSSVGSIELSIEDPEFVFMDEFN